MFVQDGDADTEDERAGGPWGGRGRPLHALPHHRHHQPQPGGRRAAEGGAVLAGDEAEGARGRPPPQPEDHRPNQVR